MADPTLGDSTEEMAALIVTADSDEPADIEVDDDVKDKDPDTKADDDNDKPDAKPDKKEAKKDDPDPVKDVEDKYKEAMDQMKAEAADMKKEISRLGYALRKAEKGGNKEEEPEFSDAQLLQMMKDHREEPEVMFQIMKQMQKQSGESIEKITKNNAKIAETRKELMGITEQVMPGALEEGTKLYSDVQTSKEYLGLEDHPYGDILSLAMMSFKNVPSLVKNVKETMRRELLGKGADNKRKEAIKVDKLAGEGSKTPAAKKLSDTQTDAVKRLGLNKNQLKYYNQFIKKGAAVQAEA